MRDAFDGWPLLGRMPGWAQAIVCVPVAIILVIAVWVVIIGGIGLLETWQGTTAAVAVVFLVFGLLIGLRSR